jgi:peptide/nickel transport system substrate-binding protein
MAINRRQLGKGIAAAAGGLALPGVMMREAEAQKGTDTLRIAFTDAVPNIDPYFNSQRTGIIIAHHAMDGLVHRDPATFKNVPALATEWKWVDPKTLDFTLRQGVKFHDGSDFSADDVEYTINTVVHPDTRLSTPANYNWIDRAEKTGPFSVRLHMKRPTPAALDYLAMVTPIWPKAYREKVGADGYSRMPIATGPYRYTKVDVASGVEYERFDGYYAGGPKGKPAFKKIIARYVSEPTTQVNELLAQRLDWIWGVNPDQMDNLNRMPFLTAVRQESMRVGFLQMDGAGRTGKDNPMTNLKVRQAVMHAIDRQTIADKLVGGGSRVPQAMCFPTQFGCNQDVAVKYDYNPAKAKQLLAEAGYPNGFDIDFTSYVQPRQWPEAVQNYLNAVGIRAKFNFMQVAALIKRSLAGELVLQMGSWGSYSINDVSAILPNYFNGGASDYARDPEVIKLLEAGGSTADEAERIKNYDAAIRRITEQAYILPLHTYVSTYAFNKALEFPTFADELPRFYLAKWK